MLTHCVVYYWVEPESRQTLRIFIMDCLAIIFLLVLTVEVAFGNSRFYHGPTAIPHVLHDGHIADTREVAAAKSAHLAALATQSHSHGYGASYGYSGDVENSGSHGDLRYHGPTAIPHVLHDGHIADTHEVAAAKAKAHSGYGLDYSGIYGEHSGEHHGYSHSVVPYHGPLAKPKVLKSGYLADTHEVAAAKKRHIHLGTNKDNYRGYSN